MARYKVEFEYMQTGSNCLNMTALDWQIVQYSKVWLVPPEEKNPIGYIMSAVRAQYLITGSLTIEEVDG